MRSRQGVTLLGLLALVGSTAAVACAATPAPETFQSESGAGSRAGKKNSKSADDDTTVTDGDDVAPATTADTDRPPPPVIDNTPAAPVEANDTTWTGTLAKTTTTKFGGEGFCDYAVHLEGVKVKVVIGADGTIKSANVTGKAVEEALNGCPHPPIAPNVHDYQLKTGAAGTTFAVTGGGATAKPMTKMTGDVAAAGTTGSIDLTWHRTDQVAPFDWTIASTVPLTKE